MIPESEAPEWNLTLAAGIEERWRECFFFARMYMGLCICSLFRPHKRPDSFHIERKFNHDKESNYQPFWPGAF